MLQKRLHGLSQPPELTTIKAVMHEQELKTDKKALSKEADAVVKSHAFGSGMMGYLPFPILDGLAVMLLQRKMLFRLAKVYRVPFSRNMAQDLLKAMAGGMAARAAMPSAVKMVPGVGVLFGSAGMATIGEGISATFRKGRHAGRFQPCRKQAGLRSRIKKWPEIVKKTKK